MCWPRAPRAEAHGGSPATLLPASGIVHRSRPVCADTRREWPDRSEPSRIPSADLRSGARVRVPSGADSPLLQRERGTTAECSLRLPPALRLAGRVSAALRETEHPLWLGPLLPRGPRCTSAGESDLPTRRVLLIARRDHRPAGSRPMTVRLRRADTLGATVVPLHVDRARQSSIAGSLASFSSVAPFGLTIPVWRRPAGFSRAMCSSASRRRGQAKPRWRSA